MTGLLDLPDPKGIAELISKVRAGDAAWLQSRYDAGGLVWLRDRLPQGAYDELGRRLASGDVAWVRAQLGTVALPGFEVFRSAGAGEGGANGTTGSRRDGRASRRPWWQWLIPALALVVLAGLALATCGGDDDGNRTGDSTAVTPETTLVVDTTSAATTSADTTSADTTSADTSGAADTTVATTVPPSTTPGTTPATTTPATTTPATTTPATTTPATPATTTTGTATTNAAGDPTPENLTVYFDSSSARISAAERARLAAAVAVLRALPAGSKVVVVGHADRSGSAAANRALSRARAAAVVAVLRAGLGADASKITFSVAAKGDAEAVRDLSKSRRVTIEIQP